jgi:hypothetical protein
LNIGQADLKSIDRCGRTDSPGADSVGSFQPKGVKMAPLDKVADQSLAFRTELKAQGKRRRERLSSLTAAPAPLRRRNDLLPPLRVEELSLADLVGPARNVRRQEAAQIRAVATSIAAFGFCAPVLIGAGNSIVHGVISVEAARQLGLARIPCIRVDHLTGAEQRLLRIALNRLGETGAWSLAELKFEFEELIIEQAPIEIAGFSAPEIDQILLGDDAPPLEQGPLAPAPDEARWRGQATSSVLVTIGSPAATPLRRTSSRP